MDNAPPTRSGDRPDISRADFTLCLLALDWGCGVEEIADRLMHESGNARENGETKLPIWVITWSHNEPFTTIEGIHSANHPLVKNWDRDERLDIGEMFRDNVHYVSSANSKGIQLADMTASLVGRSVRGIANAIDLQNYGLIWAKTNR